MFRVTIVIFGGVLSVGLAAQLSGCRSIENTSGFPPFYESYDTPSTARQAAGTEYYVRPFYSWGRAASVVGSQPIERLNSFPPFIQFLWERNRHQHRIAPLFLHRTQRQAEGNDIDWMIFPLWFWGNEPGRGSYFAFFPLGGRLKGLFAQDDVTFVLFPLSWYAANQRKNSLHLMWPIYNTVWGSGWSGWRVWPLYGRYDEVTKEGEPREQRNFFMWPLYVRRHEMLNSRPSELFFTFPFYGYKSSSRVETRTYLWPIFHTHYDKRTKEKSHMGFLFPYRFNESQTDAWPFFGVKRLERGNAITGARRRYRHFVLWPLERYDWASDQHREMTRFWVLPLIWHFYYIDSSTMRSEKIWHIWPFYRYERRGQEVIFDTIEPLWFSKEPYRRYYSRLFNLFRYRSQAAWWGWDFLYGTLLYRRQNQGEEMVFSVLGGFLEFERDTQESILRFLYLPLRWERRGTAPESRPPTVPSKTKGTTARSEQ